MTPEELAIATKRFDKDFVADEARPLTQNEQNQLMNCKTALFPVVQAAHRPVQYA